MGRRGAPSILCRPSHGEEEAGQRRRVSSVGQQSHCLHTVLSMTFPRVCDQDSGELGAESRSGSRCGGSKCAGPLSSKTNPSEERTWHVSFPACQSFLSIPESRILDTASKSCRKSVVVIALEFSGRSEARAPGGRLLCSRHGFFPPPFPLCCFSARPGETLLEY